jgi:lysophospholipase L1-like esterase
MSSTGAGAHAVPGARLALSTRRKIAFALAAFLIVTVGLCASVLALDVYLHHRSQGLGLNVWGYRGPAVGRKQPGETRIVTLGGSTVFGFGLPWTEAWPFYLEREINARRPAKTPASVINLGVPRDSAGTFVSTIGDYEYLKGDVVILYEGYNDLEPPQARNSATAAANYLAWRHQSPIFRWTGYLPILPLVFNEKAMLLLHGGDLNAAYASSPEIVFRPGLATRMTAGALKATADIAVALELRFGRLTDGDSGPSAAYDGTCGRWSQYCGAMGDAIRRARQQGQRVLVVAQPYLSDLHVDQQRALEASLARQFGGDAGVRYVNLGRSVDLRDPRMAYDGLHLTAAGNQKIGSALAPPVVEMMR